MKKQYNVYRFSKKEWFFYSIQGLGFSILLIYVFYYSMYAIALIPIFYLVFIKYKQSQLKEKRKRKMQRQLRDIFSEIRIMLQAGYSIENAFKGAWEELARVYNKDDDMLSELFYIVRQCYLNIPIEQLVGELASRSDLEELEEFSQILNIAKRQGGDLIQIVGEATRKIEDKREVLGEIEAIIAAKQLEQKIMSGLPIGIILYMRICSPGFLDILYGNIVGVMVMSFCLLIYVAAFYWGLKIVSIEV